MAEQPPVERDKEREALVDQRIQAIRKKNEEILRRQKEIEADKKNADELSNKAKSTPSKPTVVKPPVVTQRRERRSNRGEPTTPTERHEPLMHHRLSGTQGPPPDPMSYLADEERDAPKEQRPPQYRDREQRRSYNKEQDSRWSRDRVGESPPRQHWSRGGRSPNRRRGSQNQAWQPRVPYNNQQTPLSPNDDNQENWNDSPPRNKTQPSKHSPIVTRPISQPFQIHSTTASRIRNDEENWDTPTFHNPPITKKKPKSPVTNKTSSEVFRFTAVAPIMSKTSSKNGENNQVTVTSGSNITTSRSGPSSHTHKSPEAQQTIPDSSQEMATPNASEMSSKNGETNQDSIITTRQSSPSSHRYTSPKLHQAISDSFQFETVSKTISNDGENNGEMPLITSRSNTPTSRSSPLNRRRQSPEITRTISDAFQFETFSPNTSGRFSNLNTSPSRRSSRRSQSTRGQGRIRHESSNSFDDLFVTPDFGNQTAEVTTPGSNVVEHRSVVSMKGNDMRILLSSHPVDITDCLRACHFSSSSQSEDEQLKTTKSKRSTLPKRRSQSLITKTSRSKLVEKDKDDDSWEDASDNENEKLIGDGADSDSWEDVTASETEV